MVLFDKQKYACLSCIRGHRSSSCEHRDRILLQVRKPGRKSLAEPRSRFAIVRKEQNLPADAHSANGVGSNFKLVRVPNISRAAPGAGAGPDGDAEADGTPRPPNSGDPTPSEPEDDDVVLTDRFVFVHVGDNLYRRELRPDALPGRAASRADSKAHTPSPGCIDDRSGPPNGTPMRDIASTMGSPVPSPTAVGSSPMNHPMSPVDYLRHPMSHPMSPMNHSMGPPMGHPMEYPASHPMNPVDFQMNGMGTSGDLSSMHNGHNGHNGHGNGVSHESPPGPHQPTGPHHAGHHHPSARYPAGLPLAAGHQHPAAHQNPAGHHGCHQNGVPALAMGNRGEPSPVHAGAHQHTVQSAGLPARQRTGHCSPGHSPDHPAGQPVHAVDPHNYQARSADAPQLKSVHTSDMGRDTAAPLVIAPMPLHNARNSGNVDILQELGITTEEAEQLWPGALESGTDLSYASQCVMPGQCECGEGCACPDCYEHKLKFESLTS